MEGVIDPINILGVVVYCSGREIRAGDKAAPATLDGRPGYFMEYIRMNLDPWQCTQVKGALPKPRGMNPDAIAVLKIALEERRVLEGVCEGEE